MRKRRCIPLLTGILLAAGSPACQDETPREVWQVKVTVPPEGAPTITWVGDTAHEVRVLHCTQDCKDFRCDYGYLLGGFGEARVDWELPGSAQEAPLLASPITYGMLPTGQPDPTAQPLQPGTRYGVEVIRWPSCDAGAEDCMTPEVAGCVIFAL